MVGANPVLVSVEDEGFTLDTNQLADTVAERTRALLLVDLYGRPALMDAVFSKVEQNEIFVVEDAAQVVGARWQDRRVDNRGFIVASVSIRARI